MNNNPWSKLIFLASRVHLSDAEVEEMIALMADVSDWDKAVEMLIARQVGPLLYQKLQSLAEKSLVPKQAMEALRQSQLKTLSRNMVLSAHFVQVAKALNDVGIAVIAMKGIYLSEWLYKDLSLRQCSDIDLLLKAEDGERSLEVLRGLGYISAKSDLPPDISKKLMSVHYLPMIKNGVSIEIHTRIHSSLYDYEINLETLWKESVEIQLHGAITRVFRPEHLLITLIEHLNKHFSMSKFQFTGFYDITNLLDLYGDTMDVDLLLSTAETWKLKTMIQEYCTLVHRYFKVPVPESLLLMHSSKKLEDILLKSLSDLKIKPSTSLKNYKSIEYFDSPAQRISYVLRMTFPRPAYLMKRYEFTNKFLMLYYYPYRFLSQMKTALIVLASKMKN